MHRRRYLLVIPATLSIGLASCTSPAEPDWDTAQAQADAFIETAATSESSLGAGTWRATQSEEVPFDGVTLSYPAEARIEGISVACFGGGEASFGAMVRAESSWSGIDPFTLTCDSQPRTVPLAAPLEQINAIRLSGGVEDSAGAVIAAAVTGTTE
ncbi:hypothetical protein [Arthrobacter caoxuetaonis]|uniref:hypothetical protein n=1 Tax=Arthrobacter caoxuetaonis TaxID=2886935 RepID=UPI001D13E4E1|nr:hypothetical protein [Arthrobacter caoxuetaonis]MCC3282886.1 hypothetical protein [Arthrobacter caoxuetaonis]